MSPPTAADPSAARAAALGRAGERHVERSLVRAGAILWDRNVAAPQGELDLVLRRGRVLLFVEVKTRTVRPGGAFGPSDAFTPEKRRRLDRLARWYVRDRIVKCRRYRVAAYRVLEASVESRRGWPVRGRRVTISFGPAVSL